jgi:hypothetical protein
LVGLLGFLGADEAVAVSVEPSEELDRAEEFARGDEAVAVLVTVMTPPAESRTVI